MLSKKIISNAVAKFIENDLAKDIDDVQVKFALFLIKENLLDNSDILITFFENPLVSSVVTEENGQYDIKELSIILKKILNEYGAYPITLPRIPLILPCEKVIQIESCDIDKIMNYINLEVSTA